MDSLTRYSGERAAYSIRLRKGGGRQKGGGGGGGRGLGERGKAAEGQRERAGRERQRRRSQTWDGQLPAHYWAFPCSFLPSWLTKNKQPLKEQNVCLRSGK